MLHPQIKEKIALAYTKLGEIALSIAINLKGGKDYTTRQKELKDKGKKLRFFLKLLLRHVDTDTTPPTLYRITEAQVNRIITCMTKVGNLDTYPIVPTALPQPKPVVFNKGTDGTNGADGQNGTDANIIVEPDPTETQITVTSTIIAGVRHDRIKLTIYEIMSVSIAIQGSKVFEIGDVVASYNINISTTKGSNNITAITITSHSALNTALQGVLNFAAINGVSQPVVNFVTETNVSTNQDYIVQVTDGIENVSAQDSIRFYYPFLYGANDNTAPTYYTALTKYIAPKANYGFTLNGTDKYFFIMYPSSYGALARIKDQNGFVVTDAFTTSLVTVASSGLDNNWSIEYRVYRTTIKTDISNQPYTIEF